MARYRPTTVNSYLTESEVIYAVTNCNSNKKCAEFLRVSLRTFSRYSKLFRDPKTNQTYYEILKAKRQSRRREFTRKRDVIENILYGNTENPYTTRDLKRRILSLKLKQEVCDQCGYSEQRLSDNKVCLLLTFVDGNPKNGLLENLQFVCYNCGYNLGLHIEKRDQI